MPEKSETTKTRPELAGRRLMTIEELPVEARIRLENAGRWVAWADGLESLVAAADTYEELNEAVRRADASRAIFEWVPPVPIRP